MVEKRKTPTLAEFTTWFEKLEGLDRDNFLMLIGLPRAVEIVTEMPDGEYKQMALFGLAVKVVLKDPKVKKAIDKLLKVVEKKSE